MSKTSNSTMDKPKFWTVEQWIEEGEQAAIRAYGEWKRTATRAAEKPIPLDEQRNLRTSGAREMVAVIARYVLLARADQADHDHMPGDYVRRIREAAEKMSQREEE